MIIKLLSSITYYYHYIIVFFTLFICYHIILSIIDIHITNEHCAFSFYRMEVFIIQFS